MNTINIAMNAEFTANPSYAHLNTKKTFLSVTSTPPVYLKSIARDVGQNQGLFVMQNQSSGIKSALFKAQIK